MSRTGQFKEGYDPRRPHHPPEDERFWAKVVKGEGCWEWMAATNLEGYGVFHYQGRLCAAPRVSWEFANGPIPDGAFVCHHCDNPGCVRPDHLFIGTPRDNTLDALRKGRLWTPKREACPRGHPYTEDNIYWHPSYKVGEPAYRECRTCKNARSTYYNRKRRGQVVPEHWQDLLST